MSFYYCAVIAFDADLFAAANENWLWGKQAEDLGGSLKHTTTSSSATQILRNQLWALSTEHIQTQFCESVWKFTTSSTSFPLRHVLW